MELNEDTVGFRALVAARVENERAGFEQCREALAKRVTQMMDDASWGTHPHWSPVFEEGQKAAYLAVLGFLAGP